MLGVWATLHGLRASRSRAGEVHGACSLVLALARYYLGLPWHRLEGFQALVDVPVPDATQWDQGEINVQFREYNQSEENHRQPTMYLLQHAVQIGKR